MIYFAYFLSLGLPLDFAQENINKLRLHTVLLLLSSNILLNARRINPFPMEPNTERMMSSNSYCTRSVLTASLITAYENEDIYSREELMDPGTLYDNNLNDNSNEGTDHDDENSNQNLIPILVQVSGESARDDNYRNGNFTEEDAIKVLDLLAGTMHNVFCEERELRAKRILDLVRVIRYFTSLTEGVANKDSITQKIVSAVLCRDGVKTLIIATSKEYLCQDIFPEQPLVDTLMSGWKAIFNIHVVMASSDNLTLLMHTEQARFITESCIDFMDKLKTDSRVLSGTVSSVLLNIIFYILTFHVEQNYIGESYFQSKRIISVCVEAFKNVDDNTWNDRGVACTKQVFQLFTKSDLKGLMNGDKDYGMIIPLISFSLKVYESNDIMRERVIGFLHRLFSEINDNDEKNKVGMLIQEAADSANVELHDSDHYIFAEDPREYNAI